jgi:menaquinone-dependent protoporphyrinogen IX oxidase
MHKILVAYATMSGSTAEVAQAVGEEIARCGLQVDVLPLASVKSLESYSGVIVGAPMIMGWHRDAGRFLKKHRKALQRIPLAVFATAMSLTQTDDMRLEGVPVVVDEYLAEPPKVEGKLSFKERYAALSNYVKPMLSAARPAKPASIGFFGGRLEYGRLPWWAVLFAMLIIQAPAGERRNWPAIRAWAANLPAAFHLEPVPTAEQILTAG